jgi:diaminopimelate epimerase
MPISFSKMHGLGNDFVVIDGIRQSLSLTPDQVRLISDRHFGVGCDQLLVVEPAQDEAADFYYRIYNADGSEAETCGNGARCFAHFIRDKGLTDSDEIVLETRAGLLCTRIEDGGLVTVEMGVPRFDPGVVPFIADGPEPLYRLDLDSESVEIGVVSVGNPHAVLLVDDVLTAPVANLGPKIEYHARFPQRANVGFLEIDDRNNVRLRVFERGSGETLACGSGACAAVAVGRRRGLLDERVLVELPGGRLLVQWSGDESGPILMTGPATHVFEGTIDL